MSTTASMDSPSPSSSSSSHHNSHEAAVQAKPSQDIKRRRRTTKHELKILEDLYAESRNPSLEARQKACKAIGFEMKALQVWLQNRRQKEKKDAGKWKPSYTATGESAVATSHATAAHPAPTSSYSQSIASTRSSCSASPDISLHHQQHHQHASSDQIRVNKLQLASSIHAGVEDNNAVKLPPILLNNTATSAPPLHSSPLAQLPLTLPPISTVIAESSSRDFIHHTYSGNKLSPMLRQQQDENTFTRPPFQRTASVDSARSASTTCSSSRPTEAVSSQQRPIQALRRTSSQYSLSIAQDGKAQMLVTEVPEKPAHKPQLPSLATAILASSPSMSSPSTIASAGSEGLPLHVSSLRPIPSTLASAPLQISTRQSLPFSKSSNFGRVYSLPSLSSLSNNSASATLKTHPSSNNTIFSGGPRPGSPPKKSSLHAALKKQTHVSTGDNRELWMNLDSDPIEPEDEIIMNQNKRMLHSPVKRFTSVKMEDVISSSSSSSSSASPRAHSNLNNEKHVAMKRSEVTSRAAKEYPEYTVARVTSMGGIDFVAVTLVPKKDSLPSIQQKGENSITRPAPSAHLAGSTKGASLITSILDSPSRSSISSSKTQISTQITKQSQTRKRSYSKTIMSRSISLDRVILHDDSTDEENSPQKQSASIQQPRSAGLYPSGTVLGRPILSRANSHLGILHSSTMGQEDAQQSVKRAKLDTETSLSRVSPQNAEGRQGSSSPCGQSVNESSLGEPDLSFSTEASQSFDGMSRGEMSDIEMEVETISKAVDSSKKNMKENAKEEKDLPVMDLINNKIHNATVTLTPSKKQGNTLALAAIKGHMSSPIKMGSPSKKVLTEVERDCAAVLVGLGFPDVF